MSKKDMTPEERKAFGEKMRQAREAKKNLKPEELPVEPTEDDLFEETVETKTDKNELQRQIDQLMADNALFRAALIQQQPQAKASPQVNQQGGLVGVFEKYILDPDNYPSPLERLAAEPRLLPLAFGYNYHMEYNYTVRQYDTKQGINTQEPEFLITLWKNVLDDDGTVVKRYRAKRLVFHEDPQAAMVIAHDNGIQIDKDDERNFLNEMRYLRVRDWLFDVFWPQAAQAAQRTREEVIGNQLVEVITVNSESPVDLTNKFAAITKKG